MAKTRHTVFAPVYGLALTDIIGHEIKVGRVLFVSSSKIPRIRKRLGLYDTVSNLKSQMRETGHGVFNNAKVYAAITSRRDPTDREVSEEMREIKDAFWLLASSFTYHIRRKQAAISLTYPIDNGSVRDTSIFGPDSWSVNYRFIGALQPNCCEGYWKQNAAKKHFFALQKIVDKTNHVQPKWRNSIIRAASLFGKSFLAKHMAEAFMYNMIAIETLLTNQGDKFPSSLIDRLVALFGWMTTDDPKHWENSISKLYKLRCSFVHDGIHGEIDGMDLYESDTLLSNLLTNICKNTKTIKSKNDIIALSERVAACQVLGIPTKRKEVFTFSRLMMSPRIRKDYDDDISWGR